MPGLLQAAWFLCPTPEIGEICPNLLQEVFKKTAGHIPALVPAKQWRSTDLTRGQRAPASPPMDLRTLGGLGPRSCGLPARPLSSLPLGQLCEFILGFRCNKDTLVAHLEGSWVLLCRRITSMIQSLQAPPLARVSLSPLVLQGSSRWKFPGHHSPALSPSQC